MARKKSLFQRLRSKNVEEEENINLGKNLEVETMPHENAEFDEDFDEEDDMMEEFDEEGYEEYDNEELEEEFVEEDDMMEELDEEEQMPEEQDDELTSEYEGQLTIDVFQTDKHIVIKSTIAGVKPQDIDVSIDNDMVTIKGERINEQSVTEEDYYYQECYWGAFSRSVILPVDVVADKADAKLKNGILTLTLPKAHQSKSKKISVKAG